MPITRSMASPIKIDLSKMPKKPVSAPFVIAKSTEQQLADALAENDKFREAINRLVDTHNALADELDALKKDMLNLRKQSQLEADVSRAIKEGLEYDIDDLKKENAKLKKKYEAYEKEAAQAEKDAPITKMLDTGLDEMVYHLGFCSDVLGDSWVPEYETGGLAGLKKILRESSMYVHGKSCSTCDKFIGSIHD
jgi:gas vesicle protein